MEPSDVETWTRNDEGSWKRWRHPGLALDALANASPRVASLLVVGTGPEDDEQLFAAIRLARRLTTGRFEVVAGSVHPSARWLESVHQAGADLALLVPQPRRFQWRNKPPLDDVVALGGAICPELHARQEQKVTLSVCGRQNDRMVLGRHHFDRWCLAAKEKCPHWQAASRG